MSDNRDHRTGERERERNKPNLPASWQRERAPSSVDLICTSVFMFLCTAGGNGGGSAGKFVRVVGSGRGSASRTPSKRAAVTTHTSIDGSQAMEPWEDGSQLPDSDPDSGASSLRLFSFSLSS